MGGRERWSEGYYCVLKQMVLCCVTIYRDNGRCWTLLDLDNETKERMRERGREREI